MSSLFLAVTRSPARGGREDVLTDVTRLARLWRKGDLVRHQDDELTHGQPAHARECQPRADLHVPEHHHQDTDDLAALRCVPLTGCARHERQQRGTITIAKSCSWCIRAKRLRQQKGETFGSRRLPALVLNHFDVQSRRGYHYESHGFSCRLYALVLNFSPL